MTHETAQAQARAVIRQALLDAISGHLAYAQQAWHWLTTESPDRAFWVALSGLHLDVERLRRLQLSDVRRRHKNSSSIDVAA